jgi:thiol:disulfide interchange protein
MSLPTSLLRRSAAVRSSLTALALLTAATLAAPAPAAAQGPTPAATAPATAAVPFTKRHIYSETADPKADINAALVQAKREHKRVIVDFGGDWCGDCQVLDIYFHQAPNNELLAKHFVLVHVWVGHIDTNLDIPDKYGVAIHKGVPALAVLAPDGSVVFAQKMGEFEKMQHMESSSVTEFLNKWKS